MAKTELLQVRVDADVKREASQILDSLGTNVSASINMYLKQIIIQKGIPFEVRIPTQEEIDAKHNLSNITEQPIIEEKPIFEEIPPIIEPVVEEVKPQPKVVVTKEVEVKPVIEERPVMPYILTEEERNKIFDDAIKEDQNISNNVTNNELREKYFKMFHVED